MGGRKTRYTRYRWTLSDRLTGIIDELTGHGTFFQYDPTKIFRTADAVGNLYQSIEGKDRTYGAGGRLLETGHTKFLYDSEGNLAEKVRANGERWRYEWNANGMLRQVVRPDHKKVSFEYDALGRRTAKIFNGQITRWVWDGNTPLHEWRYELADRPRTVRDEFGFESKDRPEPTDHLVTWVFEEGTFKPAAKITSEQRYSILTDYLGTPVQMYDGQGELSWQAQLDVYGKVRTFTGASATDCPFRYQGQYEDQETGLYCNRFRYYSPEEGMYISQDPIGLEGGSPTLYGYVGDTNSWLDVFGLDCTKKSKINNHSEPTRSHRAAMRQAKRDAGVPTSQTHSSHKKVDAAKSGNSGRKGTQYEFETTGPGGRDQTQTISDHYEGHVFRDGATDNTPHFDRHQTRGVSGDSDQHYP